MIRTGSDAFLSVAITLPVSEMIFPVEVFQTRVNSAVPDDIRPCSGLSANQSTVPLTVQSPEQETCSEACLTL
jgi:hypothetical protein